jgi:hypothetical protein
MRILPAIAACALIAGCGGSKSGAAEEARSALRSWDAMLALLDGERARGAVPAGFAEQVRRAAGEERRKAEAKLQAKGS